MYGTSTKMHPDEVDTDEALVGRLVAAQFPQWAGMPVRKVRSAGTDNAMYRLGEDMSVRLPRMPGAEGQVAKEQRWLPHLAPHLPLDVPVPLGQGVAGEGYPFAWSVYRWLDGENLFDEPLTGLHDAAGGLGRFVAALRRVDTTGAPRSFRGGPVGAQDAGVR
ncbi:phosphotransferase, partial [Streptomyces sp. SID7760]|nr:phosphotransferase [Streptomyces sp. SID7760]